MCLGLAKCFGKSGSLPSHSGQDVIGRTIENTVDVADTIGHQPLTQGTNEGNAPANSRLKSNVDPVLLGRSKQLTPMYSQ